MHLLVVLVGEAAVIKVLAVQPYMPSSATVLNQTGLRPGIFLTFEVGAESRVDVRRDSLIRRLGFELGPHELASNVDILFSCSD